MLLSRVSIKRPVFATILNLSLVVFGLYALPRLAVDQYPDIDFPVVTVSVVYPGADPETMVEHVIKPIESAVDGISGLEQISSVAYPSVAQVILQFDLEKNSEEAVQDVRDEVFAAVGELPSDVELPIVQKIDIGAAPILNLSLTGKDIDIGALSRIAEDIVQPQLHRVKGVARIDLVGAREPQIHVLVRQQELASYNLTPIDVINSIKQNNLDLPLGKLEAEHQFRSIRLSNLASNASDLANVPLVAIGPTGLRLGHVADVKEELETEESAAFVGQNQTILLSVFKQAGGNTVEVAKETRRAIAELNGDLPSGAKLEVVSDNSKYIEDSIQGVVNDLFLGAILAIIIVLAFLREVRTTIISAIALPTAVIATFAFLLAMDFTLNMMTTLALSLSIGLLIDDAIVVIENIFRHMQQGKSGKEAADEATSEIGLAVFATTLTLCAVFVPVAFMKGIVGRFFFQFGLTVAFAVLVSLFVAFTLTPMLASRYISVGHHFQPKWPIIAKFLDAVEVFNLWIERWYKRVLDWALEHRKKTLLAGIAIFVASLVLVAFVPVTFLPDEDKGQFFINYTLQENAKLDVTKKQALELAQLIESYPGVQKVVTTIGSGLEKLPNVANLEVLLIDRESRKYTQGQLIAELRKHIAPVIEKQGGEVMFSDQGGNRRSQKIQFVFKGQNFNELIQFTDKVAGFVKTKIPDAVDVTTTKPREKKEIQVVVDGQQAADVGMSAAQIAAMTGSIYAGQKVGEVMDPKGRKEVWLKLAQQDDDTISDLASFPLKTPRGQLVPLNSVANLVEGISPSRIERQDGERQITVLANYVGKDLNKVTNQIRTFLAEQMPKSISMNVTGQAKSLQESIESMLAALGLAVVLIYMILCAQYERYLAPLVIMGALPFALTGALLAIWIMQSVISIFTMIGIILLIGIVAKNGILLIDFTLHRMQDGLSVNDALKEAGPVRLRPILMTTFAASFGMLPIAIGHGAGGTIKAPMGIAVIGGLLVSTILTLVVVPSIFSLVEGRRQHQRPTI